MLVAEQEKEKTIHRHVLIAEEYSEHLLTPYCKCGVDSYIGNKFYSGAHEGTITENVFLHSQISKHQKPTYMTLTFSEGKQVDNKTLLEI